MLNKPSFLALSALVLMAVPGRAEHGILAVQVSNPQGKPIPQVVLSTMGDGSAGAPTDVAGRTRIRLAPQTQPQAIVALTVVRTPRDLVFISPWDSQVRVPPFENESQNFASVVLAERGDRTLLENGKALVALVSKLNLTGSAKAGPELSPQERKANALETTAEAFGFQPAEVDAAIRAWADKSTDPYEKGMALLYAANLPAAEQSLAAALKQRLERFERTKREAADAAFFLAHSQFAQGKNRESADNYRLALELRPDDPVTMNNLGLSLSQLGNYKDAEPLFQRALAAMELARGRDDADLVFAINNLAGLLLMKGSLEAAEPLLRRGLQIRQAKLRPEDPRTASSMSNLATLLLSRGDDDGAEPLLLKARRIFENNPPQDPASSPPMRPMEQRALVIGERVATARPGLAAVLLNLSTLELHRGHPDKALDMAYSAIDLQKRTLGEKHPEVANAIGALAAVEMKMKNYVMAQVHFRQAVEILETALDATHPALVAPLEGFADATAAQSDSDQAAAAYRRAIAIRQNAFGNADKVALSLGAKLNALRTGAPSRP